MPNLLQDPSERSAMMARIKSKNTKPELIVFRELASRGVRFQRHYERVPGKPDVAKPRKKLAVFVDGDFWHGRHLERIVAKHGEHSVWAVKLRRNLERDAAQTEELKSLGWSVMRIWESDVTRMSTSQYTIDQVEKFLRSRD